MTDENDIKKDLDGTLGLPDEDNQEDVDVDMDVAATPIVKAKRKYGKFMLGFTALSALIIGGASGGGFVHYIMPNFAGDTGTQAQDDVEQLKTALSRLEAKNTALERKFDTQLKTLRQTANNQAANGGAEFDSTALEARIDKVETSVNERLESVLKQAEDTVKSAPAIDVDVLARLEKLQEDGSPALDLSQIEARLSGLETQNETDENETDETDAQIAAVLNDIDARQTEMETAISALERSIDDQALTPNPLSASIEPITDLSADFPKTALLAALTTQSQKKPFLERTLSKHIKVKDKSSPAIMIETIETHLAAGDQQAALKLFDSLPSEIRSAARDWRQSFN